MSNTIRVVKQGALALVYLPDGTQLRGVTKAEVNIGGREAIGTLTLTVTDFVVDSCVSAKDRQAVGAAPGEGAAP